MSCRLPRKLLKAGQFLMAVLAFAVLSTNASFAEQRPHGSKSASVPDKSAASTSKTTNAPSPTGNAGSRDQGSVPGANRGAETNVDRGTVENKAGVKEGDMTKARDLRDPKKTNTPSPTGNAGGRDQGSVPASNRDAATNVDRGSAEAKAGVKGDGTEQPAVLPRTMTKALDLKKTTIGTPSGIPRARPQISAPDAPVRNAVAARINDSVGAKAIDAGRRAPGPGAIGGSAKSTIGSAEKTRAGASISINGTGMGRPGSGPGVVGGPAKNVASINGAAIGSRR
jgi:hypothetical protein